LTAQSRFRAPLETVLFVLVAGALTTGRGPRDAVGWSCVVASVLALALAWVVALPPLVRALEVAW
jgi:hypothetical protein